LRLLADEGVDRQIVENLRREGHDVLYVAEMDPGVGDDAVLQQANRRGAILLTADKDFGELVFRQRRVTAGVVLIRLSGLSPSGKASMTATAIREHAAELEEAFAVITPGSVRIRRTTP
jgi:predicted nuclease of predicted toxin-antitoxin system